MVIIRHTQYFLFALLIALQVNSGAFALNKAKCNEKITELKELVKDPKKYKGRRVNLEAKFYSFSNLSLDYPKAMRSSKDYIGIALSRPDFEQIPLVELKLALPLKKFRKDDEFATIEHGDLIRVRGTVFDIELGEPWMDVDSISIIEKALEEENS